LQAQARGGDTVLTGPLPDRSALYGVLAQIEALGLEQLEVRRLPRVTPPAGLALPPRATGRPETGRSGPGPHPPAGRPARITPIA
jgi:hypothetical protein